MIQGELSTKDHKDLEKGIKDQYWRNAKTYGKIAPHEYFLQEWNEKLFAALSEIISKEGKEEFFKLGATKYKYRYFYLGQYRYWAIEDVLNRAKVQHIKHDEDGVSHQEI